MSLDYLQQSHNLILDSWNDRYRGYLKSLNQRTDISSNQTNITSLSLGSSMVERNVVIWQCGTPVLSYSGLWETQ